MINAVMRTVGLCLLIMTIVLFLLVSVGQADVLVPTTGPRWGLMVSLVLLCLGALISGVVGLICLQSRPGLPLKPGVQRESVDTAPALPDFIPLRRALRRQFGWRWRHRLPWLLVTGDAETVEKLAPGLTYARWQQSRAAILLWCGDASHLESSSLKQLRKIRGRRALDAVLWVNDITPTAAPGSMWPLSAPDLSLTGLSDEVYHQLKQAANTIGWRPPVYGIGLRAQVVEDDEAPAHSVGCCWQPGKPVDIGSKLQALEPSLIAHGMADIAQDLRWYGLLQLAHELRHGTGERLAEAFTPWFTQGRVLLAGLFFMPPAPASQQQEAHHCFLSPAWDAVIEQSRQQTGTRDHASPTDRLALTAMLLAGVMMVGMGLSTYNNRQLILDSQGVRQAASDVSVAPTEHVRHQVALQDTMDRLIWWQQNGTPWQYRFGLDQSTVVLNTLWPTWKQQNQRLLVTPVVEQLQQQLQQFVAMPPETAERRKRGALAYQQLKAYLMLMNPQERAEPAFLQQVLAPLWTAPAGVPQGAWQWYSDKLLTFYLRELPSHPEWRVASNDTLVANVRTILRNQRGFRNSENALYQQMLQSVAPHYADVRLDDLLGQSAGTHLLSTDAVLPGIFTRQAWEGEVQTAIEKASAARTVKADWVLDDHTEQQPVLSKEQLQVRLSERYFADYSGAWLDFLNSLHWVRSDSLSTSLDQLMQWGDVRQSPLVALTNAVRWQAGAGQGNASLGDSLLKSVRQRVAEQPVAAAMPEKDTSPAAIVAETFAPLLAILPPEQTSEASAPAGLTPGSLSLTGYLLQVSQTRLLLQQVTNAPDPQAMTLGLAKAAFSGQDTTLSQARQSAQLLAASLGNAWSGFSEAVFVQPLEQAWEGILQPARQGLNNAWQVQVRAPWQTEFDGRYPFASTQAEAAFPQLAHFLAPNSGVIDRFITQQLNGLLEKQGDTWAPNPLNTQGLTIDPAFLAAINQLSQLGQRVFPQGNANIAFDVSILPTRNVVETHFQLDDAVMKYYNQMAEWQTFHWPSSSSAQPQVSLSYLPVDASGERAASFLNYYQADGNWALLRLLEKAQIVQRDGSSYSLTWTTQSKVMLSMVVRSQSGSGPLELLALRRFKLPAQIFTAEPVVGADTPDPALPPGKTPNE